MHRVVFSPEARDQLTAIYRYVATAASPTIAAGFTEAIVQFCEELRVFPERGTKRKDIRPGLRIIGFRGRVTIAFSVGDERVVIVGVFYGGRNYEAVIERGGDR